MSYHWKKIGMVLTALTLAALSGCGEESGQTGVEGTTQVQVSQGASQAAPAEKETSPATQQASSSADQTAPAATSTPVQTEKAAGKPLSLVEQGGEVYAQCAICHGPYGKSGIGKPLAGQSKEELIEKMKLYRAGKKIGVDSSIMTLKARMLTDRDIEAVATYIAERLKER